MGEMTARRALRNARTLARVYVRLTQFAEHECNLCGYRGRFLPFGDPPRRGAMCPRCDSKERHRLVGLWVEEHSNAIDGARVLHFAPELVLAQLFKDRFSRYQSCDLDPSHPHADSVLDIEAVDLPDSSIDVVVCSHVLEHVDDKKALSEINRILVPGGLALLMFPIAEGWEHTFEDSSITAPRDRRAYFGQEDHVRYFGRDVRERIRDAGFSLTEFTAEEPSVTKYGLVRGEKVFVAAK